MKIFVDGVILYCPKGFSVVVIIGLDTPLQISVLSVLYNFTKDSFYVNGFAYLYNALLWLGTPEEQQSPERMQ